jgi:hypothetical protein
MNMAQAFDEWMRRYEEDPKSFYTEFQAVNAHRADPLSYGKQMAAYLCKLMSEPPRRDNSAARARNKKTAKRAARRRFGG